MNITAMIYNRLNIKFLISLSLLISIGAPELFSQGIDIGSTGEVKRIYLGIVLSPAQTGIINSGSSVFADPQSIKKRSFFASLEAGCFISKYLGFASGLGYSSYMSDLSLNSYSDTLNATDSDNESYERRITGKNILENQKITMLNIPLLINFQYPFGAKFGVSLQTGVNFSIPVSKKFSSIGTFTYTGYYPTYKVLFSDVPYEGFQSNVENNVEDEDLKLKSLNPELTITGGAYFFATDKMQLSLGFFYNKLLSNLSGFETPDDFTLSFMPDELNSIMQGSSKVTAQAIGLKVGVRYFIR